MSDDAPSDDCPSDIADLSGVIDEGLDDVLGLPLIPARQVNEFVYCPRLFHLEWVQKQFETNADVEQGLDLHRVVDSATGNLPEPSEDLSTWAGQISRSFWITSVRWGLTAKLDVVEVDGDGSVVPVDYKKGSPTPRGEVRDSDRAQSLVQALLLREAGYRVDHAEIWYGETRQRKSVPLTERSVAWVEQQLTEMRQVASDPKPPAPLENSPKCPRCSLVGICLPDEVNALAAHKGESLRPRRLMAADPDSRPLYIQEQGAVVGVRRGRVEITKSGVLLASYRMIDVSQLCLQGNVSVTAQAMRDLFSREIQVAWFSYGGWFSGVAHGLLAKNVDLRRAQYLADEDGRLAIATRMIDAKIRNSRTLLRRNTKASNERTVAQLRDLAAQAGKARSAASLLGIEGVAARLYFARFIDMFVEGTPIDVGKFLINGRSRRPPPDPINSMLSFLYSMLIKDATVALSLVGFDPYMGVFHAPRFGRPALALDLVEEFRPLVSDGAVITLVNNAEIRPTNFIHRAGGCQLTPDGRKVLISAYERRMAQEIKHPMFGYRVNYRRALDVQARILAAHLTGELPEYTPFTTR